MGGEKGKWCTHMGSATDKSGHQIRGPGIDRSDGSDLLRQRINRGWRLWERKEDIKGTALLCSQTYTRWTVEVGRVQGQGQGRGDQGEGRAPIATRSSLVQRQAQPSGRPGCRSAFRCAKMGMIPKTESRLGGKLAAGVAPHALRATRACFAGGPACAP